MSDTRKPIVVVGSITMDLVTRTPRIPAIGQTLIGTGFETTPGGKGANQAVAAARLGYPVAMVAKVGDDAYGPALIAKFETRRRGNSWDVAGEPGRQASRRCSWPTMV